MNDWIYGCDICQEACPWNKKFSTHSDTESFLPRDFLINNDADFLQSLSQEQYSKLFKNSSMKRTKISGLKRNIEFINN